MGGRERTADRRRPQRAHLGTCLQTREDDEPSTEGAEQHNRSMPCMANEAVDVLVAEAWQRQACIALPHHTPAFSL
jgi:hypothetical protein